MLSTSAFAAAGGTLAALHKPIDLGLPVATVQRHAGGGE
jgi:hypothetical protein